MDDNQVAGTNSGSTATTQTQSSSQSAAAPQSAPVARTANLSLRERLNAASERIEAQKSENSAPQGYANPQVVDSEQSPGSQPEKTANALDSDALQENSISDLDEPFSEDNPPTEPQKQKPWFQKVIDKKTAKLRAEQEAHKQLALEAARKDEAIKILQEQLDRVSRKAQLDPHEEELEQLRLQHRIDQLDKEIPTNIEKMWSEKQSQLEAEEKAREIVEGVKAAVAKYQGVIEGNRLLDYMAQSGERNPKIAAEKLYKEHLVAISKLGYQIVPKGQNAPETAANQPSSTRQLTEKKKYTSLRDAVSDMENERLGRFK